MFSSCRTRNALHRRTFARLARLLCGITALGLALGLVSTPARAAVEVTVEGVAAWVEEDDPGRIRDEALRDALRRAVEVGVGVMVRGESLMENYTVVRDLVCTATTGYVLSYDVLREAQDDVFFRITIRAVVDALTLASDLEELGFEIATIGNPRIAVAIREWVCENEPGAAPICIEQPFSVAGDALQRSLHQKGFSLVDPSRLAELVETSEIEAATQGDPAAARSLARALDADLTLAGDVRAEPAGMTTAGGFDWHKALATLSAQVVLRDTGEVVTAILLTKAATKTSFAAAAREAMGQAAAEATAPLVIETIAGLNVQDTVIRREIRVLLENVDSFSAAAGIRSALRAVREAQGVDLRTYEAPHAALDVRYLGTSIDLALILEAPWFAARLSDELGQDASVRILSVDFGSIEAELLLE